MKLDAIAPSKATWAWLAIAVASVGWAHYDARDEDSASATLVSTRSAAWRVLPELATTDSAGATIELWPSHGEPVRLRPAGLGHQVVLGDEVLGPADPEAVEGVWDSLRLATTLRAASDVPEPGLGDGGTLVIELPQGGTRTLVLGRPTADDVGLYGAVEGGAEGTEGLWVLESELGVLVKQAPETWLARRLVVADPVDVVALADGELEIRRGLDGHWRGGLGSGPATMLDRVAVEAKLDRLVSARLDPLVEPRDEPGAPWLRIEGRDGSDWSIRRHGTCPGRDDRVLIDRGPGRWGCVDAGVVQPWPMPGRPGADAAALLDPRLLPHEYGRVLRVDLRAPEPRVLRRYGGGWRIETDAQGRTAVFDVDEPEAYRWYRALHEAEVELVVGDATPFEPTVDLSLVTDSTAELRLRCTDEQPRRCQRDDGPILRLRGPVPPLAFDVDTFAERRLLSLPSEDVRAIEVFPGTDAATVVRQSVHFDLGIWRLDAPSHPQGDAALDELRLETLLSTLAGLRADAWVSLPPGAQPLRRLRVERIPKRGQDLSLEIALFDACVVVVDEQRPARVSSGTCDTLKQDLLVELPLERALLDARRLELTRGAETLRLQRQGGAWVDDTRGPVADAQAWLAERSMIATPVLHTGPVPSDPAWSLRVLPQQGTAYVFEGGTGWLRIAGQPWWYATPPADERPAALEPEPAADLEGADEPAELP